MQSDIWSECVIIAGSPEEGQGAGLDSRRDGEARIM